MKLEWRDVVLREGYPAINTSLTLAETEELQRLAAGKDVLEIGSAYGYSAVAMALAGAHVTAVDPHQWLASQGPMMANVLAYTVASRVDIRVGTARQILPHLNAKFDLVFIDGDHDADAVMHDVTAALDLLRPGGIIACHDHGEVTCPGVAQALDFWRPYDYIVDTLAVYRIEGPGPLVGQPLAREGVA